jgi:hypothetical protein
MKRITRKMLEARIETINSILGLPATPYSFSVVTGERVANIGTFHLSQAYGGYCVAVLVNDNGGCSSPIWNSHIPARDAYERISAFIAGLKFTK